MVRVMPLFTQVPRTTPSTIRSTSCAKSSAPGRDQRRRAGSARAVAGAAPGAARGRADRLPRSHGDRRAHGAPVRRAAHELHAQVVEPLPVVHRVRAALHGPGSRRVHGQQRATGAACPVGSDEPWFPMRRSLDEARACRSTTRRWPCSWAARPAACSIVPTQGRPRRRRSRGWRSLDRTLASCRDFPTGIRRHLGARRLTHVSASSSSRITGLSTEGQRLLNEALKPAGWPPFLLR